MEEDRFRKQHKFWLDVNKPDEEKLDETIEELKRQRLYSQTVRDGISLICDLRGGSLDLLFSLFPWVQAEFLKYMQSFQPVAGDGEGELAQKIERLELLIREQGIGGSNGAAPVNRMLSIPKPAVTFDDQDTATISRETDSSSAFLENFLNM